MQLNKENKPNIYTGSMNQRKGGSDKDDVDVTIYEIEEYAKESKEKVITATSNNNTNIRTLSKKKKEKKLENRNVNKNNCTVTSSDKFGKSYKEMT